MKNLYYVYIYIIQINLHLLFCLKKETCFKAKFALFKEKFALFKAKFALFKAKFALFKAEKALFKEKFARHIIENIIESYYREPL
ncbi:hypothetical protein DMN26_13660 [Clostridium perfringens]